MTKEVKVRRITPETEFPKWEQPRTGAGFLFGAILWFLMVMVFLLVGYIQLFSANLKYFLGFITTKTIEIPFWFSILCLIFFFPVTLGIIVVGTLVRLIKD